MSNEDRQFRLSSWRTDPRCPPRRLLTTRNGTEVSIPDDDVYHEMCDRLERDLHDPVAQQILAYNSLIDLLVVLRFDEPLTDEQLELDFEDTIETYNTDLSEYRLDVLQSDGTLTDETIDELRRLRDHIAGIGRGRWYFPPGKMPQEWWEARAIAVNTLDHLGRGDERRGRHWVIPAGV